MRLDMARILIVDDEKDIVNVIEEYCKHSGLETDVAYDGLEALEKAKVSFYDCIIMDIMMPRMSGYEAVEEIKKIKDIPIILCSAKVEEYDKLKGFEIGVDDYIVKPFSPKEVIARIKAVLKRTQSANIHDVLVFGNLKIDNSAHIVFVDDEKAELTNKEYDLLMLLIQNRTKYVSREQILDEIWGDDYQKGPRTIDTHIKMLRKDLKSCGDRIKTVRGEGYKFEA